MIHGDKLPHVLKKTATFLHMGPRGVGNWEHINYLHLTELLRLCKTGSFLYLSSCPSRLVYGGMGQSTVYYSLRPII